MKIASQAPFKKMQCSSMYFLCSEGHFHPIAVINFWVTPGSRCYRTLFWNQCIDHRPNYVHAWLQVYDEIVQRLKKAYEQLLPRLGDPLDSGVLYGPLHNQVAVDNYKATLAEAVALGGKIEFGGKVSLLADPCLKIYEAT